MMEFREIDSYLTSDEDGDEMRPQTEFDNSVLRMGAAARANPISIPTTMTPHVPPLDSPRSPQRRYLGPSHRKDYSMSARHGHRRPARRPTRTNSKDAYEAQPTRANGKHQPGLVPTHRTYYRHLAFAVASHRTGSPCSVRASSELPRQEKGQGKVARSLEPGLPVRCAGRRGYVGKFRTVFVCTRSTSYTRDEQGHSRRDTQTHVGASLDECHVLDDA
jgi:hypothetical protein